MGLMGPARTQQGGQKSVKTGGAGNMAWYNDTVRQAASSSRPASASYRSTNGGGGAQAQMQMRPISARPQQYAPQYQSALAPTQQMYPSAAAASARPSSGQWIAQVPQPLAAHEEDCICTVCSCGKHECPPTPRITHYDPAISSEARAAYQGAFRPAVRVGAPDVWKPRNVPFEGESTHKADFKRHPNMVRSALGARGALMDTGVGRNSAPFDDTTTHKSDFPAHPLGPRQSGGPRGDNLLSNGPDDRDWATDYRSGYVPHPLQARQSRPQESLKPSLPFAGQSTHQSDFPAYANARPSVPKFKMSNFQPSAEDRDFATETRTEFLPKSTPPCPAIPVASPSKPFPGHVPVEVVPGTANTYRRKQFGSTTGSAASTFRSPLATGSFA